MYLNIMHVYKVCMPQLVVRSLCYPCRRNDLAMVTGLSLDVFYYGCNKPIALIYSMTSQQEFLPY